MSVYCRVALPRGAWVCLQFVVFPDHTHLLFLFADLTSFDMFMKQTKSRSRSENVKLFVSPSFSLLRM